MSNPKNQQGKQINWSYIIKILIAAHGSWVYAPRARKYFPVVLRFSKRLGCEPDQDTKRIIEDFLNEMKQEPKEPDKVIKDLKEKIGKQLSWTERDFQEIEMLKERWQKTPNASPRDIFFETIPNTS